MFKKGISVFLSMLLVIITITACGGSKENNTNQNQGNSSSSSKQEVAAGADNDKPFAGETVSLFVANLAWTDEIKKTIPEFEEKTGIKVEIESFAENQLTEKVSVQLTANATSPDVFLFRLANDGAPYHKNGWLLPLNEYLENDAEFDLSDYTESSMQSLTKDGDLIGVPIMTATEVLYYRKDLLEEAGLSVPTTMDELVHAAQTLHDPDNEVYGFVARGQQSALVTSVSGFIYSEGGDFTDGDKATINTPEALKGFMTYGNLLRDYGPPGALNIEYPQAVALFQQGKAAFLPDSHVIFTNFVDPEKSTVVDTIGYAPLPAGDAGSRPYNVTNWSMGVNAKSTKKEAAIELLKWMTNKENTLKTQMIGAAGARNSAWADPRGATAFSEELAAVILEAGKTGVDHQLPQVTSVGEARDAVGKIVTTIISGGDGKAEADRQNEVLQKIIDRDNAAN